MHTLQLHLLEKQSTGSVCASVLSCFSQVQLFATLWTIVPQALLPMGFSRQEYWSGLPCPPPGDLPDPGTEPESPVSPALQAVSLLLSHQGNPTGNIQFSSVAQLCPTLCDPMDYSVSGFPVYHQLPEFAHTPVH